MGLALLFKAINLDQVSLSEVSEGSFFPSSTWKKISYARGRWSRTTTVCLDYPPPPEREKRAMR